MQTDTHIEVVSPHHCYDINIINDVSPANRLGFVNDNRPNYTEP